MYVSLLYYLVYQYHPKWSTMKLMKLINPMTRCYNSNFGTPKHWQNQHVSTMKTSTCLPPKKNIILQGTRKHIPPNGNFEKSSTEKRRRISQVSVRVSLPTIPLNHPKLNLNPSSPRTSSTSCKPRWLERYSSGECRNDTHSVKPRCMKRQWEAAWNRNTAGLDSEKCQWWNMVGVLKLGGEIWNQPMLFFRPFGWYLILLMDGRNPVNSPVELDIGYLYIPLFTGFHKGQVMHNFFHQQYHCWSGSRDKLWHHLYIVPFLPESCFFLWKMGQYNYVYPIESLRLSSTAVFSTELCMIIGEYQSSSKHQSGQIFRSNS